MRRGMKDALEAVIPASFEERVRQKLNRKLERLVDRRYFAEGNRRAAALMELDLESYGYPV
jgi:hypothetical protein